MTFAHMSTVWQRIFGGQRRSQRVKVAESSPQIAPARSINTAPPRGAPSKGCVACQRRFNALLAVCPHCGGSEALQADSPEWYSLLQAHVTAVQANDRAVRLFRSGQLDEAITALQVSLATYPHYATGHSNLGFLYLWRGDLDQAAACLLRALEVDPHHKEAPDHLLDVLRGLTEELVHIGLADGFLSTQPGGAFDDYNRHRRARAVGALITRMGGQGVFHEQGRILEGARLLRFVMRDVEKKWATTALPPPWHMHGMALGAGTRGSQSPFCPNPAADICDRDCRASGIDRCGSPRGERNTGATRGQLAKPGGSPIIRQRCW